MASVLDEGLLVQETRLPQSRSSGWCLAQNLVYERAKRAAGEFGDKVVFQEIDTSSREAIARWGIADAVFVDGKNLQKGPPPSYDRILALIGKRVRRL